MEKNILAVLQEEDLDINELFQSLQPEQKEHCESVADLTVMLLKWAESDGLMENEHYQPNEVRGAALYHDVGMALIPEKLLCKAESLTGAEYRVLQRHSTYGAVLIDRYRKRNFKAASKEDSLWALAAEIALSHHERWDGRGYPYRQSTTGIILCARAVAIADAYDSIVRGAPFRMALPPEYALLEISQNAGRQFEPALSGIFCSHMLRKLL